MIFIAILLPWLSFLIRGQIMAGIICVILQITLIGWLPAMIWAVVALSKAQTEEKMKRMQRRMMKI